LTGALSAVPICNMFLKSGSLFRSFGKTAALGVVVTIGVTAPVGATSPVAPVLSVVWSAAGSEQALKSWDSIGISKLKTVQSHEKDPATGKLTAYRGARLDDVIEQAMAELPVERKAQVDLVIFKNAAGGQVMIPRSVIVKYSGMLAQQGDQLSLVMPWTSKPRIVQEALPVETYSLASVNRVELSNYQERFGALFLKRRMDPLAVRGEKFFVQNCISCHSSSPQETASRGLALSEHPTVKGGPKLDSRDRRALTSYLDAYRAELALASKSAGK
jgi:hypothetical protein